MNGEYVLDTNIVIAFLAAEANIVQRVDTATAIFLPSTVVGELYYGAFKSMWSAQNIARIETFFQHNTILTNDAHTGWHYGSVKYQLQRKGQPIPENDIWIAAVTLQYDLVLATRDKHFDAVDGLRVEHW